MKITGRRLTKAEALTIFEEIKKTNNITGYTVSQLLKLDKMIVMSNENKVVGILSFMEYPNFIDLKLIIVLESYRNMGVGKKLFNYFYDKKSNSKKIIYTVTSSPAIVSLIKATGFKKIGFFDLPILAQLHQLLLVFSFFRISEFFRKKMLFDSQKFSYWIRYL